MTEAVANCRRTVVTLGNVSNPRARGATLLERIDAAFAHGLALGPQASQTRAERARAVAREIDGELSAASAVGMGGEIGHDKVTPRRKRGGQNVQQSAKAGRA